MLTGFQARSASATFSGVASSLPSSYDAAPITTCNGTTVIPRACATSGGRDAVESVTMAMRGTAEGYLRPVPAGP